MELDFYMGRLINGTSGKNKSRNLGHSFRNEVPECMRNLWFRIVASITIQRMWPHKRQLIIQLVNGGGCKIDLNTKLYTKIVR